MKGAIGNAFILNMVITFILIFYMLLIGAVAYSKAYKVNSYLVNSLVSFDEKYSRFDDGAYLLVTDNKFQNDYTVFKSSDKKYVDKKATWDNIVNPYLSKVGYILSGSSSGNCATEIDDKYQLIRNNGNGYDYCIYVNVLYDSFTVGLSGLETDPYIDQKYMYKVVSYMKFDFPIVGQFIKIPIKSETKVITKFK